MKKSFILIVAFFGLVSSTFAQEGMKAVTKASRALSTYNLDSKANADKLTEAKELVMKGFESDEVKASSKAQAIKGNVLATMSNNLINNAILDAKTAEGADFTIAVQALNAFEKSYELAEKKFQKKEALKGLLKMESILENMGIIAYQNESWKSAFDAFNSTMAVSDKLASMGEKTMVDDAKRSELVMNALTVGSQPDSGVDIKGTLDQAIELKVDNAAIYQIAYSTYQEEDPAKALTYLEKGRTMYPDDSGMLFTEINHYIAEGKLELLIDKLKQAIVAEPDNATVMGTLGNTYDQLYGKAVEAGETEKADGYFENALKYYNMATEKDPESYSSYYGIGALYFNKAAKVGKELNELPLDAAAKYKELKETMQGLYKQSYPFLQKAEQIKPDDYSVLVALKEYYVRTSDFEKSKEYKAKIAALENK